MYCLSVQRTRAAAVPFFSQCPYRGAQAHGWLATHLISIPWVLPWGFSCHRGSGLAGQQSHTLSLKCEWAILKAIPVILGASALMIFFSTNADEN